MDGEWMVGVSEISVGNCRLVSDGLELALFANSRKTAKRPRWKGVDRLQVHLTDLAHLTSSEPLERAPISLSSTFYRV